MIDILLAGAGVVAVLMVGVAYAILRTTVKPNSRPPVRNPGPWCPGCNNEGRSFRASYYPDKYCAKCRVEIVKGIEK